LGFSLLELLVVTALLGTLVALLMPAFNQARERSRAALCVGHLRQIGQATLMYHDEQGQLPASNLPGYLLWNGLSFVLYGDIVLSHGRDMARTFYCPSDRVFEPGSPATGINNLGVPNKVTASSYYVRSLPQGAPVRLTGSTKALLCDLFLGGGSIRNHPGGINVLYSDGSVAFAAVPDGWDIDADDAWYPLDRGEKLAMP
jgi:prepilin-type processing-associated H-X9-DG protein